MNARWQPVPCPTTHDISRARERAEQERAEQEKYTAIGGGAALAALASGAAAWGVWWVL